MCIPKDVFSVRAAGLIVTLNCAVADPDDTDESVALTVNVYVFAVLGIPLMTPPEDSARPVGREPETIFQL